MLVPEKLLEVDNKNIHHVTDSDTKIAIKIVLCSTMDPRLINPSI